MIILNVFSFRIDGWKRGKFLKQIISNNPWYTWSPSQMILPASVLNNEMVYNNGRPKYITYGALGFWIGHEISHGFDTKGRHFNKDGNLVEWWDALTAGRYGNFVCACLGGGTFTAFGQEITSKQS